MPNEAPQLYTAYGRKTKRDFYETILVSLKSERSEFDQSWRTIADVVSPRRIRFFTADRNRGDRRRQNIIDSTATFSHRTLAAGMHAGLTSPARPWFRLSTPDPTLAEFAPVKEWLHVVTQRMQAVFATSNIYQALPTVYGDLGTFATGCMSMLPHDDELFRCHTYPLGSYVLAIDSDGRATQFMREFELPVRVVIETFGGPGGTRAVPGQPIDWTNISRHVKALWDEGVYEAPVQVVWVVAPNPMHDPERIGQQYMRWTSCYFERTSEKNRVDGDDSTKLLRESGFNTFPIMAPRWEVTGEDSYGIESPGWIAVGDVLQLQLMQRKKNQAIAKIIDPPLVGPNALRTQKTSLLPGDVTYVDQREGMSGLRSIHEVNLNLEHMWRNEFQTQTRIQRAYYEDLWLMMQRSDVDLGADRPTAREIEERHEEKLLVLGPVVERSNDELHNPIIDRAFDLMVRANMIPEPPQELQGVRIKVEFTSVMSQAQKLVGVVGQDRFLQTMLPLTEVFPGVRKKIRVFKFVDNYAEMLGIDPHSIVPDAEASAALEAEERAAAAAQAAETAKTAGQAAASVAQIPIGQGNTVLDRVLSGVGA